MDQQPVNFGRTVADLALAFQAKSKVDEIDRQRKADQEVRSILSQTGGDWDEAIPLLTERGYGPEAMGFQERITKERSMVLQNQANELKNDEMKIGQVIPMLKAAVDQSSYDRVRAYISQKDQKIGDVLDPVFDPERVRQYEQIAISSQQAIQNRRQALEDTANGMYDLAMARYASTVHDKQSFQEMMAGATMLGVPRAIREKYGRQFDPKIPNQAKVDLNRLINEGAGGTNGRAGRSPSERELAVRQYIAAKAAEMGKTIDTLTEPELAKLEDEARRAYTASITSQGAGGGQPAQYENAFLNLKAAELGVTPDQLRSDPQYAQQLVQWKEEARRKWAELGRAPSAGGTAPGDVATMPRQVRAAFEDWAKNPKAHGIDPTLPLDQAIEAALTKFSEQGRVFLPDHPRLNMEQAPAVIEGTFRKFWKQAQPQAAPVVAAPQPSAPAAAPAAPPAQGQESPPGIASIFGPGAPFGRRERPAKMTSSYPEDVREKVRKILRDARLDSSDAAVEVFLGKEKNRKLLGLEK